MRQQTAAVTKLLEQGITEGVYPAAALLVAKKGRILYQGNVGESYLLWDIASLTKPVATATACLLLAKEGRIDLKSERVYDQFLLWDLLHHVSGLPAWRPFSRRAPGQESVKRWLKQEILSTPLEKPGITCYSDLGFMLLGIYLEEKLGFDLDVFFTERIAKPLGLTTRYRPLANGIPITHIAPTRQSKRRGVIQGEVDDDNAFLLGGVAGHSGLFSSTDDLHRFFSQLHFEEVKPPYGRFYLGWDTPSAIASQAGTRFSKKTIGHLGFTGTSMWLDLESGWEVIFLTNRVHPDPKNEKIKRFRPYLHDEIAKLLG